jgi:hypothetical protein
MKKIFGLLFLVLPGSVTAQLLIDDFSSAQGPVTLSMVPGTVEDFADGSGILQTERNIRVSGSSVAGGNISAQVMAGALTFSRPGVSNGEVDVWWDGNNNTNTFNPTGLGGLNLTTGGQDRFRVTVVSSSSASLNMRLVVWTDGTNFSERNFTLPTGGGTVDLTFASFTLGGGVGASFINVGAIYLRTVEASGDWTASIDEIRTVPVELISFSVD